MNPGGAEGVRHAVTPVHPLVSTRPAWRDVLVLTFRRERIGAFDTARMLSSHPKPLCAI